SLAEAAQLMREANVGILPVVDDGQVCGVITDRDLVVRAIAAGADLTATPVGECATGDPIVAHPDWDLEQAMEAMARARVGRLPVIDDDNELAGIVTLGSLALRSKKDKETLAAAKAVSGRSARESATGGDAWAKTRASWGGRAGGPAGGAAGPSRPSGSPTRAATPTSSHRRCSGPSTRGSSWRRVSANCGSRCHASQ